jgi:hypothetical protein
VFAGGIFCATNTRKSLLVISQSPLPRVLYTLLVAQLFSFVPFEGSDVRLNFPRLIRRIGDHLCGLVVRDPEVPGSIPGATRFCEK